MLEALKKWLRKLLVVLALPISLLVVACMFLAGCKKDTGPVCDPVHRPDQGTKPKPETPKPEPPSVCDPVHTPPVCDPVHTPPPPKDPAPRPPAGEK